MKLKVYQQGGGLIYTPFIPGRTESRLSGSDSSGSEEDDPKIDPLDKEILALMKDQNLLPSDIQAIFNSLSAFQRRTQHLSGLGGTGAYRSVMPGLLQIMNMVSVARNNKEQWDNSVAEVKKHDAGSEVALDGYGRMWVKDSEGKLGLISPSEYDASKYKPVSNSQLLSYRQRNDDLAFSDKIFGETGMDVVGMGDIRKELDDMIGKLGSIKSSSPQVQKLSDIASDLQGLGVFQTTQKYDKGDLADFSQLLYSRLSNEAKHLIDANAAIGGYDKFNYILSIIRSETSKENSTTFDPSLTKAGGLGGGSGSSGDTLAVKDTYAEHLNSGEGFNPASWMVVQPSNSDLALYAYAQDVGPVLKGEKRFETANLAEVLSNADALGAIIDANNISFGDQLLNLNDFSKVMYNSSSNMKRVYLPVKTDSSGHVRIDFEAQQKIGKLQEYLDKHGEIAYALIEEKLEEIPNAYLDKEHKIIRFKNERPFLAVNGVVSADKVRIDTTSNYVRSMDRGEGDSRKDFKDIYNNVITTGYESGDKKRYDNGKAAGRHLYEGVIYMPLIGPLTAAGIFNSAYFTKDTYTDLTQKADARQRAQTVQTNFIE